MASGIQLNSTNNSEMNIVYQGTSGATRTVVVPDKSFTVAGTDEVIGVNQTWQDVTASRFAGTTYTNSTGKPKTIYVISNTSTLVTIALNGNLVAESSATSAGRTTCVLIVPNGSTYSVTGAFTKWSELG